MLLRQKGPGMGRRVGTFLHVKIRSRQCQHLRQGLLTAVNGLAARLGHDEPRFLSGKPSPIWKLWPTARIRGILGSQGSPWAAAWQTRPRPPTRRNHRKPKILEFHKRAILRCMPQFWVPRDGAYPSRLAQTVRVDPSKRSPAYAERGPKITRLHLNRGVGDRLHLLPIGHPRRLFYQCRTRC